MQKYNCSVTPSDELVVYQTDVEHPPLDEMAFVMNDHESGKKISAILTKQDVQRLYHQLGLYLHSVE